MVPHHQSLTKTSGSLDNWAPPAKPIFLLGSANQSAQWLRASTVPRVIGHLPSPVSWRKAILHIAQKKPKPNLSFCISCDLEIHSVGVWKKCSSRVLPSLGAAPGVSATGFMETNLTASLNARGWPKGTMGTLQLPGMGCTAAQNHKSVTKLMAVQICSNGVFALNSATWLSVLKQESDTSNRSAPPKSYDTFRWQYQLGQNGMKLSAVTTQYPTAQCPTSAWFNWSTC